MHFIVLRVKAPAVVKPLRQLWVAHICPLVLIFRLQTAMQETASCMHVHLKPWHLALSRLTSQSAAHSHPPSAAAPRAGSAFRCSMNGVRIDLAPGASIGVDYWRRDSVLTTGCFLTHMHADHTVGLADSWTGPPLFCSHDTLALLREKWPRVAERARALEVGETAQLQLQCRGGGVLHVQVTPLDACHCLVRSREASRVRNSCCCTPATCACTRTGGSDVPV